MDQKVIKFPGKKGKKVAVRYAGSKEDMNERYAQMLSYEGVELQKQAAAFDVDIKELLSDLMYVVIGADVLARMQKELEK